MEYFAQLIIFVSALVAIKGGTWVNENSGLKKLSLTGYLTLIFSSLSLVISLYITHFNNIEKKESGSLAKNNVASTKLSLKNVEEQLISSRKENIKGRDEIRNKIVIIDSLSKKTDSLSRKTERLTADLNIYKDLLEEVKEQSDRQAQTVMMEYVQLRPDRSWTSEVPVYSGSIVEFFGFSDSGLVLTYNSRTFQKIADARWLNRYKKHKWYDEDEVGEDIPKYEGFPYITAIIGESGKGYYLTLKNTGTNELGGKIHIISSPRIRSVNWSWIDERLNRRSAR